jgi:serine/threonine protein kinase
VLEEYSVGPSTPDKATNLIVTFLLNFIKISLNMDSSVNHKNEFMLSEYDKIKTVGTGAYARVFLVKQKDDNKYYALKALKKTEIMRLKQIEHTYSEYMILSEISHPFIVNKLIYNTRQT